MANKFKNSFAKVHRHVLSSFLLAFSLNMHSMDQLIPVQSINDLTSIAPQPLSLAQVKAQPTLTAHCGNYKPHYYYPKNTSNPVNNNVIKFTLIAGLSKLADPDLYQNIGNSIFSAYTAISAFVQNNPKMVAIGSLAIPYLALNAVLLYLHSKLNNSKYWSQWRSNLEIEELYLIPRQTLYSDLLTNIQTRYINFKNFRDNLAPLSNFLAEVEQEETYIKQYLYIIKILRSVRANGLVFYSHNFYKQLNKRSSRLVFIKGAFLNWYAEHKLNTSEKEILVRRFPRIRDMLKTDPKKIAINSSLIPHLLPEESTEHILENIVQV